MPIYEYRCDTCLHVFEVLTSTGSPGNKPVCSKCGSDQVSKLISAGSFLRSAGTPAPGASSGGSSGCGGHRGFS